MFNQIASNLNIHFSRNLLDKRKEIVILLLLCILVVILFLTLPFPLNGVGAVVFFGIVFGTIYYRGPKVSFDYVVDPAQVTNVKNIPENQREIDLVRQGLPATNNTISDLFDTLPIALLQIGEGDEVIRANSAARKLLGFEAKENLKFDALVEGLGRSIDSWLRQVREQDLKTEMVRAKRKKGDVYVQISFQRLIVDNKTQLLAVLSDATELKSLEAQFVQSQKMQAIGQLAGGVAHDFNNLLTAITGYCDLLLLRHEAGDSDYNDLVQIGQNANRAAALVGQLLAFSRKQTLQPRSLDVNETLTDLTHLLKRLVSERIALDLDTAKVVPPAFVDGRQLEQVIMNLVVNARDAMPSGGRISIKTKACHFKQDLKRDRAVVPKGKYVGIKVSDTGSGISEDVLPKIFEPFFTTKEIGDGTGLGLSTVYGIIKQTGGFIFADSVVGEGTSFQMYLPVFVGRQSEAVIDGLVSKRPIRSGLKGVTVMLVEDEPPVRAVASRALSMNGTHVIESASAEEALDILKDKSIHIDIIVSDVVMPGMDGPTWVKIALKERPDTKVVFVSGYAKESFSGDQEQIPNAVFLPKPFSLKSLIDTVKGLADPLPEKE